MLKLKTVVMSMVTAAAIAQPSLAMNIPSDSLHPVVAQPTSDLHAQIILNIARPPSRLEIERRHELEHERERQIERERREARHQWYLERKHGSL